MDESTTYYFLIREHTWVDASKFHLLKMIFVSIRRAVTIPMLLSLYAKASYIVDCCELLWLANGLEFEHDIQKGAMNALCNA